MCLVGDILDFQRWVIFKINLSFNGTYKAQTRGWMNKLIINYYFFRAHEEVVDNDKTEKIE